MKLFKNKKGDVAHPWFALLIILLLLAVAVNFIPSGEYTRVAVNGRMVVDPDSFRSIDKIYSGIGNFFVSFYEGFCNAAGLIAMVFFVGAGFGVVKRIGLLQTTISAACIKLRKLPFAASSFIVMLLITSQGLFTGVWEMNLVFLPVVIPLFMTMGYDLMTGAAIVILASCVSSGCALASPFTTAIAQSISELPIYSGLWYRFICFCLIFVTGWLFLMLYVHKVKKNPVKSLTRGIENQYQLLDTENVVFTPALIRSGVVFLLIFVYMIYGALAKGFSFAEMSACFVAMGIFVGLTYGSSMNEICEMMADGMKEMFLAGTVMFFAQSILYLLNYTMVIDTVIHFLAGLLEGAAPMVSAVGMNLIQNILNFFVPSGSGKAAITMPILVTLADIAGVTRQTACLAYQFGDGFSNFFWFTNGALIAMLEIAGVPYQRWIKFFWKTFLAFLIIGMIMVAIAAQIHLGPF